MEIINALDPHQMAAATSKSLKSKVIAGAGTGKTRTLTARIAWLLTERRISAEKIVAVTFTNRAAREIGERLKENVGLIADGVRLGTFHSLAARILRRHATECGLRSANFGIVDDEDANLIMNAIATDPRLCGAFVPVEGDDEKSTKASRKEWQESVSKFVGNALRQISLWKAWGLTEAKVSDPTRIRHEDDVERLALAYLLYQHELERRNMVDFGDLILKVVDLFDRDPSVRDGESQQIEHLLVDEAQDANPVQIALVRHLVHVNGALTIVGDEDQSIYGFQGGYVGAMNDMAGPNADVFELITNRRCTDQILKPANVIVGYNKRKSTKRLQSGRSGAPVFSTGHVTDLNEATWVAQEVGKLIAIGVNPAEICVLFRSSHVMPPFEEAMARVGVAAKIMSGSSLMAREEVKDLFAFLKLAINPFDDLSFARIANKPVRGLGTQAVDLMIDTARNKGLSFHEVCETIGDIGGNLGMTKAARVGAIQLGNILVMIGNDGAYGRPAYDVVTTALEQSKYLEWVKKQDDAETRLANLEAIHRLAERYENVGDFIQQMALMTDADDADSMKGKVKLMTIHASKGLEFDHVFCVGFDEGTMPNARALQDFKPTKPGDPWNGPCGGGLEEERRLCHVAFTRARHSLNVTFPLRRADKRGKVRATGPSVFMEECLLDWRKMEQMTADELGRKNVRRNNKTAGYARS